MSGTSFILPDSVEEVDLRSTTRVLNHKFSEKSNHSTQNSERVLKRKYVTVQNPSDRPTVQTSNFTTNIAKRTKVDLGISGMKNIKNKHDLGGNMLLKSTVATDKKAVTTLINGKCCTCMGDILHSPCDSNTNCNHKYRNLELEVNLKQQDAIETNLVSKKIGSNKFSGNLKVGSKRCSDQIQNGKGKKSLKTSACFDESSLPSLSEYVALDCEFVGVGSRKTSALGRCSIVNYYGEVQYDIYVRPDREITDYRTRWSGIRKSDMEFAISFEAAQSQIRNIIKGKIVIGHAIYNDFAVLEISHPGHLIRDTAQYKPLRTMSHFTGPSSVSLKYLSAHLLGRRIQKKEHCSVQDATACMDLFRLVRTDWERELANKGSLNGQKKKQSDDGLYQNKEVSLLDDQYWLDSLFEIHHH